MLCITSYAGDGLPRWSCAIVANLHRLVHVEVLVTVIKLLIGNTTMSLSDRFGLPAVEADVGTGR